MSVKKYLSQSGVNNNNNNENPVFVSDLKSLMIGFGDSEPVNTESAELLQEYIIEYIQNISMLAYRRSKRKGFNEIQLKDLIYLIRNDKKKYYRVGVLLSFYDTIKKTKKKMDEKFFDKKGNKDYDDLIDDNS
jgi:hypothetical protein